MKKGFTLIELLAVIGVLILIIIIATPLITNIIKTSEKSSFIKSIDLALRSAENYANSDDFSLPPNNSGKVISISELTQKKILSNTSKLNNGAIVIYNNSGKYYAYAFVANGKYQINGYKIEDIQNNVQETATAINYESILTPITSYSLNGIQLTY